MTKREYANQNICTCDHYSPPLWVLQSPTFNKELACFFKRLGLSGDGIVDLTLDQIYLKHEGELFDHNRIFIDTEAVDFSAERIFGKAPRRSVNRYLERVERNHYYRLQRRMIPMVMMLYFGKEIYLCRTQGRCAGRKTG